MKLRIGCVFAIFLSVVLSMAAQTSISTAVSSQVPPPLIQFSNVATDESGNTLSGVVNITFSLYGAQQGGEPLWTETQSDPIYRRKLLFRRRSSVARCLGGLSISHPGNDGRSQLLVVELLHTSVTLTPYRINL